MYITLGCSRADRQFRADAGACNLSQFSVNGCSLHAHSVNVRGPPVDNQLPSFHGSYNGQPSHMSSTTSFHQRRSPPLAAQTVSGRIRHATSPVYHSTFQDGSLESPQAAPPLGQQSLLQQMSPQQAHSCSPSDFLQHSANQMTGLCATRATYRLLIVHLHGCLSNPSQAYRGDRLSPLVECGMSGMAFSAAVSLGNVSPKYLIGDHSTSYNPSDCEL